MPALFLNIKKINIIKNVVNLLFSKSFAGIVEPYYSLECEVTWQPGFDSPERGEFILHVKEGSMLRLKCVAHVMISLEYDFYFEGYKLVKYTHVYIVGYMYSVSKN